MKKINHIISANQFTKKDLREIFKITDRMKTGRYRKPLKNKILATLFYEPSTRTRLSFESAMLKLGGQVLTTENAKESSSAFKGESLKDSIKIISSYVDAIVIRHPDNKSMDVAAKASKVPIINAGNGTDEHPTQAILDFYTISKRLNKFNNIHIALVGDLKNGRTVHSLINLMGKYNTHFYFISPAKLKLSVNYKNFLDSENINYLEEKLENIINKIDVLYMTRIQKERFESLSEYKKINRSYLLSPKIVKRMKKDSIILHPLPRIQELPEEIDDDYRSYYFKQAENGLYARMALLYRILRS